jgi:hypothetical protein
MVIPRNFTIVTERARERFRLLNKIKYRQAPKRTGGATISQPVNAARLPFLRPR